MEKNSECIGGWMHRYRMTRFYKEDVEEICEICKDRQIFKQNTPNHIYLSYHLRLALQKDNKRFKKEYNK